MKFYSVKKEIIVPSFSEWYSENTRERKENKEDPMSQADAKRYYQDLLAMDFDFPAWNEGA